MSRELVNRMIQQREQWFDVGGGKSLLLRRPTELFVSEWAEAGAKSSDMLRETIRGWKGFKEVDLIPSGGEDAVAFDPDLALEWISDRGELLIAITEEINRRRDEYKRKNREQEKN